MTPADDAAERAARGAAWEAAELRATVAMLRGRVEAEQALRREHGQRIGWAESVAAAAMRQGLDALTLMRERRERLWARVRAAEADPGPSRGRWIAQMRALTARVVDAEAEAARRTDEVVAIGEALGRPGATGAECVAEARRLREAIEGRTTPPTEEELEAHRLTSGMWAVSSPSWAELLRGFGKASMYASDHRKTEGAAWRWVPLTFEGRPCPWPGVTR